MYVTKSWAQRRFELGLPALNPYVPRRIKPIQKDYIDDLSKLLATEIVEKLGFDILSDQKKKKGNPVKNTIELLIPVFSGLIDNTVKELVSKGKLKQECVYEVMKNLSNKTLEKIDKLLTENL